MVSIVPCASYRQAEVDAALEACLLPLGCLNWVRPGMTIALKANLVTKKPPEAAATTHPSVLMALTKALVARGANVVVGDSPGGLYNQGTLSGIYAATGMREVEQTGARLNADFSEEEVSFPEGVEIRRFHCTSYLLKADAIINVCKLKSHGMMGMTAAAKNMFGAIPGTMKGEMHFQTPEHERFANMIVDINERLKPRLSVVDAITCMEGNGPTAGTPKHIGALIAGESPHEVDVACARLIGLLPSDVPTIAAAEARGLVPEPVSITGPLDSLIAADFHVPARRQSLRFANVLPGPLGKALSAILHAALNATPRVDTRLCTGCMRCREVCPAKAISKAGKLPVIDRSACIRCFCCQEFCPSGSMRVHRTAIARFLQKGKGSHEDHTI